MGGHIASARVNAIVAVTAVAGGGGAAQGPAVSAAILASRARCSAVRGAYASYDVDVDEDDDDDCCCCCCCFLDEEGGGGIVPALWADPEPPPPPGVG